jgi:hypothetical protein
MHPVYRQLLAAAILLITVISTCNKCQKRQAYQDSQKGWNSAIEQQMYDVFYTRASGMATNEETKQQFAKCCVDKMKQMFPEGVSSIKADMSDSVKVAVMKMGAECAKTFEDHVNIWQPEVIKQLKLQLYSYPETKMLPENMKAEYVDCVAFDVRTEFPNGLGDQDKAALKKFIEKSRTHCLKLLLNKYQKNKATKK